MRFCREYGPPALHDMIQTLRDEMKEAQEWTQANNATELKESLDKCRKHFDLIENFYELVTEND